MRGPVERVWYFVQIPLNHTGPIFSKPQATVEEDNGTGPATAGGKTQDLDDEDGLSSGLLKFNVIFQLSKSNMLKVAFWKPYAALHLLASQQIHGKYSTLMMNND